jgi:ABC-2 type transport system permease protein
MIRMFCVGMRFQVSQMRASYGDLVSLITLSLFTLAFLAIVVEAGRGDLAAYAILGSTLITVWNTALYVSGEFVESDRVSGTLEALAAAPASLAALIAGRIATTTAVSFLGLAQSVLVARVAFGIEIDVHHWAVLTLTVGCTAIAMTGTATVIAGLFVLSRATRMLRNSLSYPLYILGGTLVPIALLPGWLQPASKLVFLSWAADLLRDCMRPPDVADVPFRLAMILLLGGCGFAVGAVTISRVVRRLRRLGTVSYA